jgi:hypothetical protein
MKARAAALLLLAAALACHRGRATTDFGPPALTLDVRNHSPFDVNVFALPSPASQTRIRLGNVIAFADAELRVPTAALRQGSLLVLYLHAVGSGSSWISPEVSVSEGVRPCLDVHSDLSGDLRMSVFYSRITADTGSGHCTAALTAAAGRVSGAAARAAAHQRVTGRLASRPFALRGK